MGTGGYENPFLICMGLSFGFTMLLMLPVSLVGPAVRPKAFNLDKSSFKLAPGALALIVLTILFFMLYVKFW